MQLEQREYAYAKCQKFARITFTLSLSEIKLQSRTSTQA